MLSLKAQNTGIVLLAAGTSTRMGSRHKLRLPLGDGRSVLEHSVEQAASWEPAQLVVVMQPGMDDLRRAISRPGVSVVINDDYMEGMSSSLRKGVMALNSGVDAALVLLGDQPFIDERIIAGIMEAFEKERKPVVISVYGDIPGPPTLFRRELFPELLALTGDEGGRQVVRRDPARVACVLLPEDLIPPDLDTPQDYERYLNRSPH